MRVFGSMVRADREHVNTVAIVFSNVLLCDGVEQINSWIVSLSMLRVWRCALMIGKPRFVAVCQSLSIV